MVGIADIIHNDFNRDKKMWFKIQNQQITLYIFAKPNAKKSALVKVNDDELHIALHAKPHEGEANKELIAYFSKLLRIPKSQVLLRRGESSRYKQLLVPLTESVRQFLQDAGSGERD